MSLPSEKANGESAFKIASESLLRAKSRPILEKSEIPENVEKIPPALENSPKSISAKPDWKAVFDESATLADMVRALSEDSNRRVIATLDQAKAKGECNEFQHRMMMQALDEKMRFFRPWPDWVLRVAAEVWAVRFPRIPKQAIYDCFTFVHHIFFCPIRGEVTAHPEWTFFSDLPGLVHAMLGHMQAWRSRSRQLVAELEAGPQSPSQQATLNETKKKLEKLDAEFEKAVWNYIEAKRTRGDEVFAMMEDVGKAKRATFDKRGEPRVTTATPIYEKILAEWIKVESLGGMKELVALLDPVLGRRTWEQKYQLVKKLCQRVHLQFPSSQLTQEPA